MKLDMKVEFTLEELDIIDIALCRLKQDMEKIKKPRHRYDTTVDLGTKIYAMMKLRDTMEYEEDEEYREYLADLEDEE